MVSLQYWLWIPQLAKICHKLLQEIAKCCQITSGLIKRRICTLLNLQLLLGATANSNCLFFAVSLLGDFGVCRLDKLVQLLCKWYFYLYWSPVINLLPSKCTSLARSPNTKIAPALFLCQLLKAFFLILQLGRVHRVGLWLLLGQL